MAAVSAEKVRNRYRLPRKKSSKKFALEKYSSESSIYAEEGKKTVGSKYAQDYPCPPWWSWP